MLVLTLGAAATQIEKSGVDVVSIFAQYGILGLGFLALAIFARGAYKRESDRADRLDEKNDRLNDLILERFIPALESATSAVKDSTELLRAIQRERELAQITERHHRQGTGG